MIATRVEQLSPWWLSCKFQKLHIRLHHHQRSKPHSMLTVANENHLDMSSDASRRRIISLFDPRSDLINKDHRVEVYPRFRWVHRLHKYVLTRGIRVYDRQQRWAIHVITTDDIPIIISTLIINLDVLQKAHPEDHPLKFHNVSQFLLNGLHAGWGRMKVT